VSSNLVNVFNRKRRGGKPNLILNEMGDKFQLFLSRISLIFIARVLGVKGFGRK
jgi:hypothetical protein